MLRPKQIMPLLTLAVVIGVAIYLLNLSQGKAREPVHITINRISADGVGEKIGEIVAETSGHKFLLKPNVHGLEPGKHAFHIHQNPDCGAGEKDGVMIAGLAAGAHFDPHGVMSSHGHDDHSAHDHSGMEKPAGDLPELVADEDGVARQPVEVKTLSLDQIFGRSIMIHAHGETPDDPQKAKGGGNRIACGVIDN